MKHVSILRVSKGLMSKRKTGFSGFLVCAEAVRGLVKDLVCGEDPVLKYVLMYKMSQDQDWSYSLVLCGRVEDGTTLRQCSSGLHTNNYWWDIISQEDVGTAFLKMTKRCWEMLKMKTTASLKRSRSSWQLQESMTCNWGQSQLQQSTTTVIFLTRRNHQANLQVICNIVHCWLRCKNGEEENPLFNMPSSVDNNEGKYFQPVRGVEIKWRSAVTLAGDSSRSARKRRSVWWECRVLTKVDYHMVRDYQTQLPQQCCRFV